MTETKQNATFRGAALTIYQIDSIDQLPDKLSYLAYAVETCPTTGRKHLQAFAYSFTPMRLTGWKKIFPTAHIESMRGTFSQNEKYCSKEGQLVELGVRPMEHGHRRDLAVVCERIMAGESMKAVSKDYPCVYVQYHNGLRALQVMQSEPYEHDTVRGYWLWGVRGAGKTHYARTRFGSDYYIKPQNKWFENYQGQKVIVLDDYDCGDKLGHYIKIWTDKWACSGEVKGGSTNLQHHHFVITSNYSIEQMFPDPEMQAAISRRCEIIHFPEVFKKMDFTLPDTNGVLSQT